MPGRGCSSTMCRTRWTRPLCGWWICGRCPRRRVRSRAPGRGPSLISSAMARGIAGRSRSAVRSIWTCRAGGFGLNTAASTGATPRAASAVTARRPGRQRRATAAAAHLTGAVSCRSAAMPTAEAAWSPWMSTPRDRPLPRSHPRRKSWAWALCLSGTCQATASASEHAGCSTRWAAFPQLASVQRESGMRARACGGRSDAPARGSGRLRSSGWVPNVTRGCTRARAPCSMQVNAATPRLSSSASWPAPPRSPTLRPMRCSATMTRAYANWRTGSGSWQTAASPVRNGWMEEAGRAGVCTRAAARSMPRSRPTGRHATRLG
mmetsp:Transcript_21341/g.66137  ORF Transcript_21341/g.66137 Transcript_21341/m.66137 type:complete len:321 (+) Transcript_21341:239-1201(+)